MNSELKLADVLAPDLLRELREAIGNEYMDERARRRLTVLADKMEADRLAPLATVGGGLSDGEREALSRCEAMAERPIKNDVFIIAAALRRLAPQPPAANASAGAVAWRYRKLVDGVPASFWQLTHDESMAKQQAVYGCVVEPLYTAQPARVDEAMVTRACNAYDKAGDSFTDPAEYPSMHRALEAALTGANK